MKRPTVVGHEEIAAVASLWSGIPFKKLTADERMLLVGLDAQPKKQVIGQDEAVAAICRAVKRSRLGLKQPDRPIAAVLFCGPTGMEKTELTKALAASYFVSESAMLRFDMSEYMERHNVSELIGSPPGYVAYGEGGALTEAIRKRPFTIVLLDEIEKAHPDIFSILLQLFEDGHLTDSHGKCHRLNSIGFLIADDASTSYAGMKALFMVMEELKLYFRPELFNRIHELVVFCLFEKPQGVMDMTKVTAPDLSEDLLSESLLFEEYKSGDIAVTHLGNPFKLKIQLPSLTSTLDCFSLDMGNCYIVHGGQ